MQPNEQRNVASKMKTRSKLVKGWKDTNITGVLSVKRNYTANWSSLNKGKPKWSSVSIRKRRRNYRINSNGLKQVADPKVKSAVTRTALVFSVGNGTTTGGFKKMNFFYLFFSDSWLTYCINSIIRSLSSMWILTVRLQHTARTFRVTFGSSPEFIHDGLDPIW